ncbi:unnamed protein product [Nyctereutes procyonoides]|uniref:(raccoon dog) hypothetical protein n=1 Tax=Nyctereutes procyonoides TaxID=34880 RepID=A0A811ZGH1_NYCPR|nr:unnamed protein product [Nyctereutes procyonoides]
MDLIRVLFTFRLSIGNRTGKQRSTAPALSGTARSAHHAPAGAAAVNLRDPRGSETRCCSFTCESGAWVAMWVTCARAPPGDEVKGERGGRRRERWGPATALKQTPSRTPQCYRHILATGRAETTETTWASQVQVQRCGSSGRVRPGQRFKAKSYVESNKKSIYQTIMKGQIISSRKWPKKGGSNMGPERAQLYNCVEECFQLSWLDDLFRFRRQGYGC